MDETFVRERLPGLKEDGYFRHPSYEDLLQLLGKSIVNVSSDGYQGYTWELLKGADGRFGYLSFGWGSCSGCDALEGCDSYKDLAELLTSLAADVKWFDTAADGLNFMLNHDWEGDVCGVGQDRKKFIAKCIEVLK